MWGHVELVTPHILRNFTIKIYMIGFLCVHAIYLSALQHLLSVSRLEPNSYFGLFCKTELRL